MSEHTYYPHIRALLASLLAENGLPSDVRVNTAERRAAGDAEFPDLGPYDRGADFVIVSGHVKVPSAELPQTATSTGRNNQVGRYLACTGVVILSNVQSFGLLTIGSG